MRGQAPSCTVQTPASLAGALEILFAEKGSWRPLAGGTDLMVPFAAGTLPFTRFLNLWGLEELQGIEVAPDSLTLGALTTYAEIRNHPVLRAEFPNLVQSAWVTGAMAIQNRGTLAGNIANGSPAADTPPSLLAYGAEVQLQSLAGSRWVPYESFHTGYKQTAMLPEELITRIRVHRPAGDTFHFFRKVGTRKAQAISKVCLAAYARAEAGRVAEFRLGLGSVAPVPMRALTTEMLIQGQSIDAFHERFIAGAKQALMEDIRPIDDIRSTASYRRKVAANVLGQLLEEMAERFRRQ
ncbi:MAG: xanthine dehydrogenase family protein subunit M [Holophagaceae bacterium]|nr:xanthine dehydrogenase family protein subunit M [Holophagaceae bacterium]